MNISGLPNLDGFEKLHAKRESSYGLLIVDHNIYTLTDMSSLCLILFKVGFGKKILFFGWVVGISIYGHTWPISRTQETNNYKLNT